MAATIKGPELNRDWVGLRVRLRRRASNSFNVIPAGTEGVVQSYSPGKSAIRFTGIPCSSCGVAVVISGMHRSDFEIITPESEWPDTRGKGRRYR